MQSGSEREAAGFRVIDNLLEAFCTSAFNKLFNPDEFSGKQRSIVRLLPEHIIDQINVEGITPYEMLLCITDFISGLTDSYALSIYRKINGIAVQVSKPF